MRNIFKRHLLRKPWSKFKIFSQKCYKDTLYQNCTNGYSLPKKGLPELLIRIIFNFNLLNHWSKISISSQKWSSCCSIPKLTRAKNRNIFKSYHTTGQYIIYSSARTQVSHRLVLNTHEALHHGVNVNICNLAIFFRIFMKFSAKCRAKKVGIKYTILGRV